jgi:hypothetical protein
VLLEQALRLRVLVDGFGHGAVFYACRAVAARARRDTMAGAMNAAATIPLLLPRHRACLCRRPPARR